jgi:hypothetical protein
MLPAQFLKQNSHFLSSKVRVPTTMEKRNHTVTEFILLVFTTDPVMLQVLFMVFLAMCMLAVVRNCTLIVLIFNDTRIHTPMYYFHWKSGFSGSMLFLGLQPKDPNELHL